MTDYYKLLGVEKNASKEEIKEAYEKQVEKIKKEVVNEKRLDQFLNIFKQAYEALNDLEENQLNDENATLIMNQQEVQKELKTDKKSDNYLNRNNSKSKGRSVNRKNNDLTERGVSKNKDKRNKSNDNKEKKGRKPKAAEKRLKSNTKQIFDLLTLPFKILNLLLIGILTLIVILLQIINIISWIVTKVLIVGSISVGAIHLYQVKLGKDINYNILILAGSVLVASFFLPYALKFLLKVFEKLNNLLKKFIF